MSSPSSQEAKPKNAKKSFPKSRRLLRHADFDRVYKQGKRHFATHMTVFYLRHDAHEGPRLRVGFTVRKVLGGAVIRNCMKRRLREAVRLQESLPQGPVDIVMNPKSSLLTADFAELKSEVARAFEVIDRSISQEALRERTQ